MHHVRPRSRRIMAAVVTVALAAGALTALPASAAPAAAQVREQSRAALSFPRDADVVGAGPDGFLSRTRATAPEFRWTRYADGSSTVLPGASAAGGGTNLVVTGDRGMLTVSSVLKVYDMAKPDAAPVLLDLDALGGYSYAGLTGDTLLLSRHENGYEAQYAVTLDADVLAGGAPKPRKLAGSIQVSCAAAEEGWAGGGFALYDCALGQERTGIRILVDLATGEDAWFVQAPGDLSWWGAASATHAAWRESRHGGSGIVAVRRDAPGQEVWIPDSAGWPDPLYLVGGWLATGERARIEQSSDADGGDTPTKRPFTLRSADRPEDKFEALTAYSSAVAGPGGSLLVRGGTAEHGEGLYRISPRADGGRPDVELVASTGQSTVVSLVGSSTPDELTGARVARGVDLGWDLSRADSRVGLTVTHVPSRTTVHHRWDGESAAAGTPRRITWHWDGKDLEDGERGAPARNGEYRWELTARPDEGIGPELRVSGRFFVTRPPAPHDYDDDGAPDVLARDPAGVLWRFGTRPAVGESSPAASGVSRIGSGWQAYDLLESVGNVAGDSAPDSVARDRSGTLWLYQGTGSRHAPFAARTPIGGGWQVYDRITGGSDVTGDGRPDLLAADKAGVLWLYRGTGKAAAPFSVRERIGSGWDVYDELTATGDLAGAGAGDLLARDREGVLWLYLGRSDGTFAPRTRVGRGWDAFKGLTAVGDADGDGRADLVAWNGGETFYAGTGDSAAPFRRGAGAALTQGSPYDSLF
ncbi:FG-GAP repeat domain-containing protein [Streptomyces fradiae]|uniref:FG-GAP repeat domain-containing protein n=1 Tax=Streptomyces fradiae TaxID=1906 RepID=UPI002943D1B6|nr:VCBS repeat-containing protein [Streptomyces fradiae]WOI61176.1 VCBS repeat-containing protein [Streptomyces fradiae]